MNRFVRVTLLFKNPSAVELIHLTNVIWVGKSLRQQEILVQVPESLSYTSTTTKVDNLKVLRTLETNAKPF